MKARGVKREILTLLYKYEEAYQSGRVESPVMTREMIRKALVDGFCDAYKEAASLEPLLFAKMVERRNRAVRRGLKSLEREGLVKYTICRIGNKIVEGFKLSDKGCEAVKQLINRDVQVKSYMKKTMKLRERMVNRESEVKEALKSLWSKGSYAASLDEIYEELWANGKWESREEFEAYWSRKKLAIILKDMGVKVMRKRNNGKTIRLYILPSFT